MRLTAKQPIRRGGVTIQPGESFELRSSGEARALVATGRATDYIDPATFQAQQREQEAAQQEAEREALRDRAAELGVEVDRRWGTARLEEEIAAAEHPNEVEAPDQASASADSATATTARDGRYQRRDMQAEDKGG